MYGSRVRLTSSILIDVCVLHLKKTVLHVSTIHIFQIPHTEFYMLTVHGSHMLIKIPTQNATR